MSDPLSPLQFQYDQPELGESFKTHRVRAFLPDNPDRPVGNMLWSSKRIEGINTDPWHQRQGIATAMWNEGHRLAGENRKIPAPRHASDRTNAGDAWAHSVGGALPRRRKVAEL